VRVQTSSFAFYALVLFIVYLYSSCAALLRPSLWGPFKPITSRVSRVVSLNVRQLFSLRIFRERARNRKLCTRVHGIEKRTETDETERNGEDRDSSLLESEGETEGENFPDDRTRNADGE